MSRRTVLYSTCKRQATSFAVYTFTALSTFGRGAPDPVRHGAAHAMFRLRGEFRKTDLAEMHGPTNGNGRVMQVRPG